MLRSAKSLFGYRILSLDDAEVGKVKDFYFDDLMWTVRYLVDDTGGWLHGRSVLLSPVVLGQPDWDSEVLTVLLSEEQIMESPGVDMDKPVSRQKEEELNIYYGWPSYWAVMPLPVPMLVGEAGVAASREKGDPHLRSIREVAGYSIEVMDGDIGQVDDFILDDEGWTIRYMVVDTGRWLPGKKILISPGWVDVVEWLERKVRVDLMANAIKDAPEFDPAAPVNREYETRLYDFYGRPVYWE